MNRRFEGVDPTRLQGLIWDLDGTLVDSRRDLAQAMNAALLEHGFPPLSLEAVMAFVGHGARELVRGCLAGRGDEAAVLESFLVHYAACLVETTRPYAGIFEVLTAAQRRGLYQAVLTNKPQHHTERILQGLGLASFFDPVIGGDRLSTRKPDPQGAIEILRRWGVGPGSVVLIGDSDTDVRTARAAGLGVLGVRYGIAPDSLVSVPPDLSVESPWELLEVLGLKAS